jgi:hypothetical protein
VSRARTDAKLKREQYRDAIVHRSFGQVGDEVSRELMLYRYQEHFHLSYQQAIETPWAEIERAHFVWSLEAKRVKLEEKRQEFQSRN